MWLITFIILNVIISHSIIADDVGDACTPNSIISDGICTRVSDCLQAIRAVKENKYHSFQRCGFDGLQEIVCCPHTTDKFGPTEMPRITKRISERECETIKNESIPKVGLYIIGGVEAQDGEFPYMVTAKPRSVTTLVALELVTIRLSALNARPPKIDEAVKAFPFNSVSQVAVGFDRGNGYEFDCGGSLLSKNTVLTAAHCIDTLDGIAPSMVRAGVINIQGNAWNDDTDYRVADIITHPRYTRREKYHDLALLKLERDIRITSSLYPVCIESGELPAKAPLTVTGWGKTSNTRNMRSNILLKADVIPVPSDKCGESYTNWRKLPQGISKEQICAGDPKGLHDTCQGDSGGPLQLASGDNLYRLVGVTSFGRGCGSPIPGVYTRVAHYLDWIESVVWPA